MKKLRILVLLLCAFVFIPGAANAVSVNDLAKAGDTVNVKKEMEGTGFIAGSTVTTENKINGIAFIAGNTVTLKSTSDYVFIGGNAINIDNATFKDGFIAGNTINIESENIERDVYVAGNSVTIKGKIGRNASIGCDTLVVDGVIEGNLNVASEKLVITKNAKINGTLTYNDNVKAKISKAATIAKEKTYKAIQFNTLNTFQAKVISLIESYACMVVFGIVLMFVFKKAFKTVANMKLDPETILKNFGIGFLLLLTLPLAVVLLICTILGISVGLILLGLYIVTIYASTVFSTYYIFNSLLGKKINNNYVVLLLGLLIVYALRLVPYISGFVSLIILFIGLGIIYRLIYDFIKSNK